MDATKYYVLILFIVFPTTTHGLTCHVGFHISIAGQEKSVTNLIECPAGDDNETTPACFRAEAKAYVSLFAGSGSIYKCLEREKCSSQCDDPMQAVLSTPGVDSSLLQSYSVEFSECSGACCDTDNCNQVPASQISDPVAATSGSGLAICLAKRLMDLRLVITIVSFIIMQL